MNAESATMSMRNDTTERPTIASKFEKILLSIPQTLPTPKSACFSMYTRELKVRVSRVLGRARREWCVLQATLEGVHVLLGV